jgi:hypothetical protein
VAPLLDRISTNCYSGEEKANMADANWFALSEKEMNGQITEEADDKMRVQAANSAREGSGRCRTRKLSCPRGKESGPVNLSRRASGPRTVQGKQKSKYNAIKHGIFAEVVLPNDESRLQYESLLGGLFEDLNPQGRLEETLR